MGLEISGETNVMTTHTHNRANGSVTPCTAVGGGSSVPERKACGKEA